MDRKRLIYLVIGICCLIAGVFYIFLWNKPHRSVESEKGIVISADSIVAAYNADENAANAKYLNKAIQVQGVVAKAEKNQDAQPTILFASNDPMGSVFCTMRDKEANVAQGSTVTVKGICTGHTIDVLLTDCVLVK